MYGQRNTYKAEGHLLGLFDMKFAGLSKGQMVVIMTGMLLLNIGALFGAAYLFQMFWAWYVPMWWSTAPILNYWQSMATLILLGVVRSTVKGHKPEKS